MRILIFAVTVIVAAGIAAAYVIISQKPDTNRISDVTCNSYSSQAEAQEARATVDSDADGVYCESLPCPCSSAARNGTREPSNTEPPIRKGTTTRAYTGRVVKVVDGDTLKVLVRRRVKTVRVIGIDTPESHKPSVEPECGSEEAASAAFKWAFEIPVDADGDGLFDHGRKGRRVRLQTDGTQNRTDRYGRLLAYVGRGSSDFGRSQIATGWAKVLVYESIPFKRYPAYETSLHTARSAKRGVWRRCAGDFHSEQSEN